MSAAQIRATSSSYSCVSSFEGVTRSVPAAIYKEGSIDKGHLDRLRAADLTAEWIAVRFTRARARVPKYEWYDSQAVSQAAETFKSRSQYERVTILISSDYQRADYLPPLLIPLYPLSS